MVLEVVGNHNMIGLYGTSIPIVGLHFCRQIFIKVQQRYYLTMIPRLTQSLPIRLIMTIIHMQTFQITFMFGLNVCLAIYTLNF